MHFRHRVTKAVVSATGKDATPYKDDPEWDRIDDGGVDESQQMPGLQPPEPA